jgi:HK97 family phage portal protein
MGLFDGFEVRARQTSTGSSADGPDSDFWYSLVEGFGGTASGRNVGRVSAEKMITVAACVTLISGDLAGLPLRLLKKRADGGFDEATDHQLNQLLKYRPNEDMTSFTWRETMFGHNLKAGVSTTFITRDDSGKPKALTPIVPEMVRVKRIPQDGPWRWLIQGDPQPRSARDILHIPAFSHDGIHGVSPITHFARESIGTLISMEQFISVFFANGMSPTGVIKMPEKMYLSTLDQMSPDGRGGQNFLAALRAKFGNSGQQARSPFVLQGGMDWQSVDSRLVDAQFIEILGLKKLDICGLFKVPPHKIGHGKDSTSYNNTEQENLSYVVSGLMPWINRFEQAAEAKLLSPQERNQGYRIKFNVTALLRGDMSARASFYDAMMKWGIFTVDDVRALEDMNPAADKLGGKRLVPVNMIYAEDLGKLNAAPVAPGGAGKAGSPMPGVEQRSIADDLKAIRARDRIAARFQPLLTDAMAAVVSREGAFIKAEIEKNRKLRAGRSIQDFIDEFYRTLPDWIIQRVGPTMTALGEAIQEAASAEIGVDPGMTSEMSAELREYIKGFARQYADGDRGQLLALLSDPEAGGLDALEQRLDEWHEGGPSGATRAEKVGFDQVVTLPNMMAAATFWAAGYGARWTIRGEKTCPYCRALNGKIISRGQAFLQAGDHQPEGADVPMSVRTTKYPALHQGCDCVITWGKLP